MAQALKNIREFIEISQRKDITKAVVKTNSDGSTKFKLRGAHKEYTLTEADSSRAAKILQTLDPALEVTRL